MTDAERTSLVMATVAGPSAIEHRAREWWRITIYDTEGNRAARAQLRRCTTVVDALCIPAAIGLARRLGRIPGIAAPQWKQNAFERVLALAIVLSHVRHDNGIGLLRALGWGRFPDEGKAVDAAQARPILSELRFKRLLQCESDDDLIRTFTRLVSLAGNEADVAELARVFLHWDDDRTKRDVALTYFRANSLGLDS